MALKNRKSVLAIKEETTEGVGIRPTANTDFVTLQSGFSVSPSFDEIKSDELRASIGMAKPLVGLENPSASFSHYLRHSGSEGIEPDFDSILKSVFGSKNLNATQRATTSGSTVSVVNLAAGGTDFVRGRAVLVKDGTNGFNIRPVLSVATNNLTLGFNLPAAPASGVNVGKCLTYAPADEGHPSLSMWFYRANGGAVELLEGARVNNYTVDFNAGGLINQSFDFEGMAYSFNPITLAATDTKLDFSDSAAVSRVATLVAQTYKDPHLLAQNLQDSMNTQGSADTFTVTYSNSTGKFTIASSASPFQLKNNTGANAANTVADALGYSVAADKTGAQTYTADNAMSWSAPFTPVYDSTDPLVAQNNEVLFGDSTSTTPFEAKSVRVSFSDNIATTNSVCQESGVLNKFVTLRQVDVSIQAYLSQNDVDLFKRYRAGDQISLCYNFGVKAGNNWVAGKCGCFYLPVARVTKFELGDESGIVSLMIDVQAYVDNSGNGEVYLNFL